MHNYFHNDAVKSGQSEQVWLYNGSTSPLLAGKTFLSIDFEVDPKLIGDFAGNFFKVEAEDDQTVVTSPLSDVFFMVLYELRASVVFALEPQLNSPLDFILETVVLIFLEGPLVGVRDKTITLRDQCFQFLFDFRIRMFSSV